MASPCTVPRPGIGGAGARTGVQGGEQTVERARQVSRVYVFRNRIDPCLLFFRCQIREAKLLNFNIVRLLAARRAVYIEEGSEPEGSELWFRLVDSLKTEGGAAAQPIASQAIHLRLIEGYGAVFCDDVSRIGCRLVAQNWQPETVHPNGCGECELPVAL